jgi:hypothetical protein
MRPLARENQAEIYCNKHKIEGTFILSQQRPLFREILH